MVRFVDLNGLPAPFVRIVRGPPSHFCLARKAAAAQRSIPAGLRRRRTGIRVESLGHALRAAFFTKYVAPLYTNNKISATEAYARGFSWGLMQVMGQVARESGFDAAVSFRAVRSGASSRRRCKVIAQEARRRNATAPAPCLPGTAARTRSTRAGARLPPHYLYSWDDLRQGSGR